MALVLPGILGAIGLCCLLAGGWLWLRDPWRRVLCPGPRMAWTSLVVPIWILHQPRCGYDLSAHRPARDGSVTCPECGRVVRRQGQRVRSARAWRPGRFGLALLVLAWLSYRFPPVDASRLVAVSPTDVLLRGEGLLGEYTPLEARDEIRRRAMDHQLSEQQTLRFVQLLLNDLRDDQLVGNAKAALEQLEIFGLFDPQALWDALDSPDAQERRMVADLLRSMPAIGAPNDKLLRISVEDLRSDDRRWNARAASDYLLGNLEAAKPFLISALHSDDRQQRDAILDLLRETETQGTVLEELLGESIRSFGMGNGYRRSRIAFLFLLRNAATAEPRLAEAMAGSDPRARLLAAVVAGCANRADLLPTAVPILVEHLADNNVTGDAIVAARALWGFGPSVVPFLEPYRANGDTQQRRQVEYILRRMTTKDSVMKLQLELPETRLTGRKRDALSLHPEELDLPTF